MSNLGYLDNGHECLPYVQRGQTKLFEIHNGTGYEARVVTVCLVMKIFVYDTWCCSHLYRVINGVPTYVRLVINLTTIN